MKEHASTTSGKKHRLKGRLVALLLVNFVAIMASGDAGYNVFLNFRYPPHTWIGNGSNQNWSNPANWSDGVVPGTADTANFTGICYISVAACSAVIDVSTTVGAINIASSWMAGSSITTAAGVTITVNGTFTQAANTFDATNATSLTISGASSVSAGTMTLSGGTNTLGAMTISTGNFNVNGTSSIGAYSGTGGTTTLTGTSNFTSTLTINGATFNANAAV